MKQALPDALSQLSSNGAAYGAGAFVTGGICVIWLWRPGTIRRIALRGVSGSVGHDEGMNPSAKWLIFGLIDAAPTSSTQTTSSRYGLHARNNSPPLCFFSVSDAGLSPSSRMIVFGFQSFSTNTMTTMHVSELAMSVSSGPT